MQFSIIHWELATWWSLYYSRLYVPDVIFRGFWRCNNTQTFQLKYAPWKMTLCLCVIYSTPSSILNVQYPQVKSQSQYKNEDVNVLDFLCYICCLEYLVKVYTPSELMSLSILIGQYPLVTSQDANKIWFPDVWDVSTYKFYPEEFQSL